MSKLLSEIIKLSPVNIEFVDAITGHPSWIGVYWGSHRPKRSIEVVNRLSTELKIATLLHEIGHANCSAKGCSCVKVVTCLGELYAEMFALQWLLDGKHKCILRTDMEHLERVWPNNGIYGDAWEDLIKTKLWKDCKRYIGKSMIGRVLAKIGRSR